MTCAPPKTCQNQKSFWIPSNQPPNTCRAGWANFFHQKHVFSKHPMQHTNKLTPLLSSDGANPMGATHVPDVLVDNILIPRVQSGAHIKMSLKQNPGELSPLCRTYGGLWVFVSLLAFTLLLLIPEVQPREVSFGLASCWNSCTGNFQRILTPPWSAPNSNCEYRPLGILALV